MQGNKQTIPEGYMQDAQGRLWPVETIREIDRERDTLVRELFAKAEEMAAVMAKFKEAAMGDVQAFVDLSAEKYSVKLGGVKGNVTLMSFNGELKIQRANDEYMVADERLQIAKELIDQCIHKWSGGADPKIRVLVNDAFRVDKKGKVNVNRILGLRRLDIQDETWQEAMKAIGESLQVLDTKAYLRFYKRDDKGVYQPVSLNIAA